MPVNTALGPGFPAVTPALRGGDRAESQHLINLGSQALQIAYAAAGRLDGVLAIPVDPWSSPAATLLVREAGGTVEPAPGGPWPHTAGTLLVTNGHIREELAGLMEPEQKQEGRAGHN